MALTAGSRLGPYEIVAPLGAGGMGEVYRARDTRLDRTVALKLLPAHIADDPEFRERFDREARAISQLNHPNICTLHDVGRDRDTDYLVLEYLEGETLAARLARGPRLKAEEVVAIAVQICEALETAHRHGIVHRDLKPANVMLTRSGRTGAPQAKLLDFGIARARAAGVAPSSQLAGLTGAPTVTTPHASALTGQGAIVGTFQYMSPEQIEGQEADARSDIWALGCVLYEMLAAKRPFESRTQAGVIGAILERDPDLSALDAPPALRQVVRSCLAKDPNDRFQSAHDVALQLRWAVDHASAPATSGSPSRRSVWPVLALVVVGFVAFAAGAVGTRYFTRAETPIATPLQATLELPTDMAFNTGGTTNLAVSPDGTEIIYASVSNDEVRLVRRRAADPRPVPIPGTEGGLGPFFSPDGQWVGFVANGKLRKTPLAGGPAQTICEIGPARGAAWTDDGTIVFGGVAPAGLMRVSAEGGTPQPFTRPGPKEVAHAWPSFIAGTRSIVFAVNTGSGWDEALIAIQSLDETEHRTIFRSGTAPRVTSSGHLLFGRGATLLAAPFAIGSLSVTGPAVPIATDVFTYATDGRVHYAVSNTGVLVFCSGGAATPATLILVDRTGASTDIPAPPRAYESPRFSPDGRRAALTVRGPDPDIWLLDIARATVTRITFSPGEDESPVWSPDGARLAYASSRSGVPRTTFVKRGDGGGDEQVLFTTERHHHLSGWSPDGASIISSQASSSGYDIYATTLATKTSRAIVQSPFSEQGARLSPDGKWIAYSSNETGRSEVYVVSFPEGGSKQQVSAAGGSEVVWTSGGRELMYRTADRMMSVDVQVVDGTLRTGSPRVLFSGIFSRLGWAEANYDVTPDGKRFLMIKGEQASIPTRLTVVTNWAGK